MALPAAGAGSVGPAGGQDAAAFAKVRAAQEKMHKHLISPAQYHQIVAAAHLGGAGDAGGRRHHG